MAALWEGEVGAERVSLLGQSGWLREEKEESDRIEVDDESEEDGVREREEAEEECEDEMEVEGGDGVALRGMSTAKAREGKAVVVRRERARGGDGVVDCGEVKRMVDGE